MENKSNRKNHCCVESCEMKDGTNVIERSNLVYHKIPGNKDVKSKWLKILQDHCPNIKSRGRPLICSLHFTDDCYFPEPSRRLKPGSFPTIFASLQKNNLDLEDKLSVTMESSKENLNCTGIGLMSTTWIQDNEEILKKISGKVKFYSTLKGDNSCPLKKDSLVWLVHSSNCTTNSQNATPRAGKYLTFFSNSAHTVDISLAKVTKFERNAIFFYGFKDYLVHNSVVFNIVPYEDNYHNANSFATCDMKDSLFENVNLEMFVEPKTENLDETLDVACKLEENNLQLYDKPKFSKDDLPVDENSMDFVNENNSLGLEHISYSPEATSEITAKINTEKKCSIPETSNRFVMSREKSVQYYNCTECSKLFVYKKELVKHMKSHKVFYCWTCNKSFQNYGDLEKHKRIAHYSENMFECDICKKVVLHKSSLRQHIQTVHTREAYKYQCQSCGKMFAQKKGLEVHIKHLHTKERPFPCPSCHYSFVTKSKLKQHLMVHTGEKPYCCEFCGRRFNLTYSLAEHLRRHRGEKPYNCSFCDRRFVDRKSMKKHEMIHTRL